MSLTRDSILNAEDVTYAEVDCPEWGGTVRIRELTGSERDSYEASLSQQRGSGKNAETVPNLVNMRAKLLVRCIVDDDGARLFKDSEAGMLGVKSAKVVTRIWEKAAELSGLSNEETDEVEADLKDDPNDDSTLV